MKRRLLSAVLVASFFVGSMLGVNAATLKETITAAGGNVNPVLPVGADIVVKEGDTAESLYANSLRVTSSSLPVKFDFRASVDMSSVEAKFNEYINFAKNNGFTDVDNEIVSGKFTVTVTYPKQIVIDSSFTGDTTNSMNGFSNKDDSVFEEIGRIEDTSGADENKLTIEIKVKDGITAAELARVDKEYLSDFYLECTGVDATSYGTYSIGGTVEGHTHIGTVTGDAMDKTSEASVGTITYLFRQKNDPMDTSKQIEPAVVTVARSGSGSSSSETVTVSFETGSGATSVSPIKVKKGETINVDALTVPTREGYEFLGYYADKALTKRLTGSITITKNTVLYAKWEKVENTVTININISGKTENIKVAAGDKLDVNKLPIPEKEGFIFAGYYTDAELTQRVTDEIEITENMTLYSRMVNMTPAKDLNARDHFAYIAGYPDGEVKPFNNISREEVATIFYRLLNVVRRNEINSNTNTFTDVSDDRWSNTAISVMAAGGYITGYPDGTFGAEDFITRAEFVTIASRFTDEEVDDGEYFADIKGHWAEKYIITAANNAWIDGSNTGMFRPDDYITRADAIRIVNRMLVRYVNAQGLHEYTKQWADNTSDSPYYYDVLEATNSHDYEKQEDGYNDKWSNMIEKDFIIDLNE